MTSQLRWSLDLEDAYYRLVRSGHNLRRYGLIRVPVIPVGFPFLCRYVNNPGAVSQFVYHWRSR